MQFPLRPWIRSIALFSLSLYLLAFPANSMAGTISVQLSSPSLSSSSGAVTFYGTVTNASGSDLNASDFFFNFFDFDPTAVTPTQDLGLSNFPIPDNSTSLTVALFDVSLLGAPGSTFSIEFQLQDDTTNVDFSAGQTVTVSVAGTNPTPEPGTSLLLIASLFAVGALFTVFRTLRS